MKRVLALALVLVCICVLPVQAAKYGYKIDVSAMKALENSSAFPVRVILKTVVEENYDTENYNEPCDQLCLTIENGTSGEISGFKLYFVAYDEAETTKKIDSSSMTYEISSDDQPELYSATAEGLSLAAGSSIEANMPVHWNTFVGVRAFISEYTAADGTVVVNPDFAAWQTLAFGMVSDTSTELD